MKFTDITDHYVVFTVCVSIPNKAEVVNNRKIFNKIDYNSIFSILSSGKWTIMYDDCSDVNKCYDVFDEIIKNAIYKSITCMLVNANNKSLKE